jgi:hypothetical protein
MTNTSLRVLRPPEADAANADPVLIAIARYKILDWEYRGLIQSREGKKVSSPRLDRLHRRWTAALMASLTTIPASWTGIYALAELCLDHDAMGQDAHTYRAGLTSLNIAMHRIILPDGTGGCLA